MTWFLTRNQKRNQRRWRKRKSGAASVLEGHTLHVAFTNAELLCRKCPCIRRTTPARKRFTEYRTDGELVRGLEYDAKPRAGTNIMEPVGFMNFFW